MAGVSDPCPHCGPDLSGTTTEGNQGLTELEKIMEKVEKKNLEEFSGNLCTYLVLLDGDSNAGEKIKKYFYDFLEISDESSENQKAIFKTFWNKHNDKLICKTKVYQARVIEHFTKRAIELKLGYELFGGFLLRDHQNMKINVNAVEIYDGKKETVLDFIENILNDPKGISTYGSGGLAKLKRIKRILVARFEAKRADEL
jgi:hypothetical protein